MDTPRLPPLDPLRGFVASARHLSFTRAATELHLTQSAISRQVQTLEQALGVRLFVRGVRTLALTPQGERLFGRAEVWLREWGELAEALRAADRRRPVTVTASIGIAALWLVPRLLDFQARHPDIDVRLAAGNRMMDLAREGIDVAIRYCADRDAPPDARRLFGESVFPVASPAVGEGLVLCAATLPRLVLLDLDDVGYPWLRWDDWLAAIGLAGARPQAVVQFNHYDQMIQAAAAGQGLAIGRAALVAPMLADGRLVAVGDARREVAGRGYWLVTAPGRCGRMWGGLSRGCCGRRENPMSTKYELIIYWSGEDQSFVVEVPELPGCMADGETCEQAVVNAQQVIREWIDTARELDRPIPEPRGRLMYA